MIELRQLGICRADFALQDINLKIPSGAYGCFVGPSGSGKTTILEHIAGLLNPAAGKVILSGVDVTNMGPADRAIGYVPQDLALFSSMTVYQNLAFGIRKQRLSKAVLRDRVNEIAGLLTLTEVLSNRACDLSRGQAQRVALGRAVVMRPRVLLMDEPLSSIDEATKLPVLDLLKNLHTQHRPTVLHVTHTEADLANLATVRCELSGGRIVCVEC